MIVRVLLAPFTAKISVHSLLIPLAVCYFPFGHVAKAKGAFKSHGWHTPATSCDLVLKHSSSILGFPVSRSVHGSFTLRKGRSRFKGSVSRPFTLVRSCLGSTQSTCSLPRNSSIHPFSTTSELALLEPQVSCRPPKPWHFQHKVYLGQPYNFIQADVQGDPPQEMSRFNNPQK